MSSISIDVMNDLQDGSHLKGLLNKGAGAVFAIASEVGRFAGQPVSAAVGVPAAKVTLSAPGKWTTKTGIEFSLTPEASCTVAVAATSTKFKVAKSIGSKETEDIVSDPRPGKVWVNIDLDFSITGKVSGSGTVSGIGIAGKASGSATATLSYCHAVDGTTDTLAALREAFSTLVFPFEPDCALRMGVGDAGRVNFEGTLGFGLDVTYGLGDYKFSAPSVDAVKGSVQAGFEKLTLPSAEVKAGIKGSLSYKHTDRFGAIVVKADAHTATLCLVRSGADETGESLGISVGVSATKVSATLDQTALTNAVNRVTGSGGSQAATVADALQSSLLDRTNKWLCDKKGDAGLLVELSQQKSRALLYKFQADLDNANLTRSWEQLSDGDVERAAHLGGGLTLAPGSGVETAVTRSVSVGLHFFNFFSASERDTYFQKSRIEIGPHGSIRYLYDIGEESEAKTAKTLETSRVHFVASVTGADRGKVKDLAVDFVVELSETNKPNDGNAIASAIGSLPASADVQAAQTAMHHFVAAQAKDTLNLAIQMKASAYGKLACSPFTGDGGDVPPALPQEQDQDNWNAYHDAARILLGYSYLNKLHYGDWAAFNRLCNNKDEDETPNRRRQGNRSLVTNEFYNAHGVDSSAGQLLAYFLESSARFMNLCDHLHTLAGERVDTLAEWDRLLKELTAMSKDLGSDWSRPCARAILALCGGGSQVTAQVDAGTAAAKKLTCTVTVS